MAENKTKPTTISPRTFINQVENEQKRKDCHELAALMQDITGHPPKMWGSGIVLYLGPGLENTALTNKLGKHKTGKGCLYVRKLDDVDRGVLRDLIVTSVKAMRERYPRSN